MLDNRVRTGYGLLYILQTKLNLMSHSKGFCEDRCTDVWTDGQMDKCMDGTTDGQINGWMDEQMYVCMNRWTYGSTGRQLASWLDTGINN